MIRGIAQQMVHHSPDALLLVDQRGQIVYVNAAAVALFGYPAAQLIGQTIEQLVPEKSRGIHERYREGFSAAPATREMGARLVALSACRQDGTEFPAEIRLAPIQEHDGEQGSVGYVLAAVRDVTDRRRITDELRAARAEADSANQSKSRFLATASHDLRQPLQTLQLLNAALARRLTGEGELDLIHRQQGALDSMADLLNALLDVTKLEAGNIRPSLDVVPLVDVFADLRQQFEALAADRGLALTIPPTDLCLRTDRILFRQVLQNLLNNALQYTREGGVTVSFQQDAAGLAIRVADTGVGIPAPELDRVFDEYYRVDTKGPRPRGFGLGLTIVRQISRLLGYTVKVESELGRGTTFALHVPAGGLVAMPDAAVAQLGPAVARPDVPKPALLIVEDDAAVRDALELVLSLEGYPTRTADSGPAAMDVFADHGTEIDVVVSDFHLGPGKNGLELLEEMREIAGRDLPAVILSGDTSPVLARIDAVSRVALLRKPVDARQLIARLEELFGAAE
ncbi:MAG: PAS domain S-box protein [Chromatiales bacterium]|nr:PAS domain S-box protein [Chromatiales bacterium]